MYLKTQYSRLGLRVIYEFLNLQSPDGPHVENVSKIISWLKYNPKFSSREHFPFAFSSVCPVHVCLLAWTGLCEYLVETGLQVHALNHHLCLSCYIPQSNPWLTKIDNLTSWCVLEIPWNTLQGTHSVILWVLRIETPLYFLTEHFNWWAILPDTFNHSGCLKLL